MPNGKKIKRCHTCGQTYTGHHCKNRSCKQNQKARAAQRARASGSRPAHIQSGWTGWGTSSGLTRSVLAASSTVGVNADALRDRVPRKPDGKCPFCGLEPCVCATPDEIRRARPFMEARDD